jgi:hypothetical protein
VNGDQHDEGVDVGGAVVGDGVIVFVGATVGVDVFAGVFVLVAVAVAEGVSVGGIEVGVEVGGAGVGELVAVGGTDENIEHALVLTQTSSNAIENVLPLEFSPS